METTQEVRTPGSLATLRKIEREMVSLYGDLPTLDDDWQPEHGLIAEIRTVIEDSEAAPKLTDTQRSAQNIFGAMLALYGSQTTDVAVAEEVNRLIGEFFYTGQWSASQIRGARERLWDAMTNVVAAGADDVPGRVPAAPPRLPLAILGQGTSRLEIGEGGAL